MTTITVTTVQPKNRRKNRNRKFNKQVKAVKAKQQKRASSRRAYICTGCGSQVHKPPCGKDISTKDKPELRAGLGHWRCKCGVRNVKVVVQTQDQEKKTA
jgi:hypothetical protein